MKQYYPRIYGISTLGIRQHFNCDYRFHALRTDFSGESGSGKSMVADMIQLILVGSAEFKSGTDGNEIRDTKGMVLENKGSRYGRGYILLNIESAPQQFITLGGYLETASNQLVSFIIQEGYDWDEHLKPMGSPVYYNDLLCDGDVETVEELQKKFAKGYLKVLPLKKYHQLLYKNEILSIDLAANKQNLKSFATILRAFSRGKGFSTSSAALKTFLFGEEDQLALMEKYREEVRGISADFQQHQLYQEEIKLIHQKQKAIEDVASQFQIYDRLKKDLVTGNAYFWSGEFKRLQSTRTNLVEAYIKATVSANMVNSRLCKLERNDLHHQFTDLGNNKRLLIAAEQGKKDAATSLANAREQLKIPAQRKALIDEMENWLIKYNNDLTQLRQGYAALRQKARSQETRDHFIAYLTKQGIQKDFEDSVWKNAPDSAAKLSQSELTSLLEAIHQKEIFTVFADLDNAASLAAWAIKKLSFPLSLEQESLLVHFQHLPQLEPDSIKGERYLPFPEKLLLAPEIPKRYNHGFWIALTGVYEFVENVKLRFLDVADPSSLAQQLSADKQNALADLVKLNGEYNRKKRLSDALNAYPGLFEAIAVYSDTSLTIALTDTLSQVTETDFARRIALYEERDTIIATYEELDVALSVVYRVSSTAETLVEKYQENIDRIEKDVHKRYGSIELEMAITSRDSQLTQLENELEAFLELHEKPPVYPAKLETGLFGLAPTLTSLIDLKTDTATDVRQATANLDFHTGLTSKCNEKLEAAQLEYVRMFGQLFEYTGAINTATNSNPEEGSNSLKTRCESAFTKFITLYDAAGETVEDQTILMGRSVGVLANQLLPTVFPTSEVDEQLIGQQIAQRLHELTDDMKKIGSRKLEILNHVFSEVHRIYNGYLSKVHNIHNYLKSKEHTITGGNHASLLHTKSVDYPDSWMITFRKRLSEQLNNQGLFEKLYQEMDINQLMIDVYRECGGKSKVTYEDLLNPKSYFDLKFEIKLDNGQNNAGSNGQTYTANALLCLARLSLIQDANRKGLKFMPIDEAEGLGGNYEMLQELAQKEYFQLITMSIETAGDIKDGQQYIYIMHDNRSADESSYVPPLGIFSDGQLTDDLTKVLTEQ
ncbi:MAG: hypothetical protein ACTHJ8_09810 [Mucilaginibacter sp.]